jgi:hypothetical protein
VGHEKRRGWVVMKVGFGYIMSGGKRWERCEKRLIRGEEIISGRR